MKQAGYYLTTINRLAITQLVLGILCVINAIVIYSLYGMTMVYAGGLVEIWTEIWFIVAGATGIAVKTKQRCNVHMGFCILATVMAAILAGEAGYYGIPKWFGYRLLFNTSHIPLFLFAIAEFIISIVAASFCCRAVSSLNTPAMATVGYAHPQGAVVIQQGVPQGGAVMMAPGIQQGVPQGGAVMMAPGFQQGGAVMMAPGFQQGAPQGGTVMMAPGTQHVVYQGAQPPTRPGYSKYRKPIISGVSKILKAFSSFSDVNDEEYM